MAQVRGINTHLICLNKWKSICLEVTNFICDVTLCYLVVPECSSCSDVDINYVLDVSKLFNSQIYERYSEICSSWHDDVYYLLLDMVVHHFDSLCKV